VIGCLFPLAPAHIGQSQCTPWNNAWPLPDTPPPAPAQTAPRKKWADGRPPGTHPAPITYRNVAALYNPRAQQGGFGNVAGLVARSFSMTYRIPGEMRCYESVSVSPGVDPDLAWVGEGLSGNKQVFPPSVSHRNTASDVLARLGGCSHRR
jgi:hypothetical protein